MNFGRSLLFFLSFHRAVLVSREYFYETWGLEDFRISKIVVHAFHQKNPEKNKAIISSKCHSERGQKKDCPKGFSAKTFRSSFFLRKTLFFPKKLPDPQCFSSEKLLAFFCKKSIWKCRKCPFIFFSKKSPSPSIFLFQKVLAPPSFHSEKVLVAPSFFPEKLFAPPFFSSEKLLALALNPSVFFLRKKLPTFFYKKVLAPLFFYSKKFLPLQFFRKRGHYTVVTSVD